jgi:hypothetical protein
MPGLYRLRKRQRQCPIIGSQSIVPTSGSPDTLSNLLCCLEQRCVSAFQIQYAAAAAAAVISWHPGRCSQHAAAINA